MEPPTPDKNDPEEEPEAACWFAEGQDLHRYEPSHTPVPPGWQLVPSLLRCTDFQVQEFGGMLPDIDDFSP